MSRFTTRWLIVTAWLFSLNADLTVAQKTAPSTKTGELKFVVYLSRHGVRSPTGTVAQYNPYSLASWPAWDVPPGYLTAHGYHLMELFGAYDRTKLAAEGLLSFTGCEDVGRVSFYADSDQRTRETGRALAEGMFPGCHPTVQFLPEGTNDPLFHYRPPPAQLGHDTSALAAAAIAGRIGGDPSRLADAYRSQLHALDKILSACGSAASSHSVRTSLFDIPSTLKPGDGSGHLADLRGPLNTASTLAENLLLEYAQGMDPSNVGWGCVDGRKLRSLMELHTSATDFTERTPLIAQIAASNLLSHILETIDQAATKKATVGVLGKPGDRGLFLIGHDTNLTNVAGLLNLTWIAVARRHDTPPGGALVFELWQDSGTGEFAVRTYFTAQTLEQMRSSIPLTPANPPDRVPVFLPGCSGLSCSLPVFVQVVHRAINARFVSAK